MFADQPPNLYRLGGVAAVKERTAEKSEREVWRPVDEYVNAGVNGNARTTIFEVVELMDRAVVEQFLG